MYINYCEGQSSALLICDLWNLIKRDKFDKTPVKDNKCFSFKFQDNYDYLNLKNITYLKYTATKIAATDSFDEFLKNLRRCFR